MLVIILPFVLGTALASEPSDTEKPSVDLQRPPSRTERIDFHDPDAPKAWQVVNDTVMGGKSSATIGRTQAATGLFEGEVSLDNNGGFASVRHEGRVLDWSHARGIEARVRSDGRRYRLLIRLSTGPTAASYQAEFKTQPGGWMTVRLPFNAFRASWRGRSLPDAPPLNGSNLTTIGFLIGDKQEGSFQLEVSYLKPWIASPEKQ